jgi:hypothetical protein
MEESKSYFGKPVERTPVERLAQRIMATSTVGMMMAQLKAASAADKDRAATIAKTEYDRTEAEIIQQINAFLAERDRVVV